MPASIESNLLQRLNNLDNARNIINMGIDYREHDNDTYFWFFTKALLELGHNVITVRNKGLSTRTRLLRRFTAPHIETGTWIPRDFCGLFEKFFYIVRTIFVALWICFNLRKKSNEREPRVVICDGSCVAIPLLRFLGGFQVITLEYYKDFMAELDPFVEENVYLDGPIFKMRNWFLSFSHKIIIPCLQAHKLLKPGNVIQPILIDQEVNPAVDQTVGGPVDNRGNRIVLIYPPAEGEYNIPWELRPEAPPVRPRRRGGFENPRPMSIESLIQFRFVVFSVFDPQSNIHCLIEGFVRAISPLDYASQSRLILDIVGFGYTLEHRIYRRQLKQQIAIAQTNTPANINIISNPTFETRFSYYHRANAILNANNTARFVPSILEAFYFGRLVVSLASDFAYETISNGTTGIIMTNDENDYESIAHSIREVAFHIGLGHVFISLRGCKHYERLYSYDVFTSRISGVVNSLREGQ